MSLLGHRRNEEILEDAKTEQVAKVMRRRILEWFGYVKRSNETDNIRAGAEIKMKRPRGKHGRDGGTLSGRSGRNRPLQVGNVKSL